jgi:hypothetical protein
MGKAFGKSNPDSTISVLNGSEVDSDTPGAVTIADPNRGLTQDQIRNRKLLRVGTQFGGSVLDPYQPQQQPRGAPVQFTFANNQPGMEGYPPPMKFPFFGRY